MNPLAVAALMDEHPRLWGGDMRPAMRNKFLFALRRRLDYFELLAIASILLGVAIIAGIVLTYDMSRQTDLDDARAQAQLYSKQLPDDL
jgi:hypothetical protein